MTVYGAPSASPCVGKRLPWLKLCTRTTAPPGAAAVGVAWAAALRWSASAPTPARSALPVCRAARRDRVTVRAATQRWSSGDTVSLLSTKRLREQVLDARIQKRQSYRAGRVRGEAGLGDDRPRRAW